MALTKVRGGRWVRVDLLLIVFDQGRQVMMFLGLCLV